MKKIILLFVLLFVIHASEPAFSQCSMCRAVAEEGVKDNEAKVGRGLNKGILYLLAMPYALGGVAFFIWRKNRRKKSATS